MGYSKISQRKRQDAALGFIDLMGEDKLDYRAPRFTAVEDALSAVAANFIQQAINNLNASDRNASGKLEGSITPTEIIRTVKGMSIDVMINDYYKFIDKGVKGWQSGTPNSPYSFKKPDGSKHKGERSLMVEALKGWLKSELRKRSGGENAHPISRREKRRKKITDAKTQTAIVVAGIIRRKGLKKTNFWTKATNSIQKDLKETVGQAFKVDIINSITNGN